MLLPFFGARNTEDGPEGSGFSAENPSPHYLELLHQYALVHRHGVIRPKGRPRTAEGTFFEGLRPLYVRQIAKMIAEADAKTLLDFGSGKRTYCYEDAPGRSPKYKILPEWGDTLVTCYDPGYEPFAEPPAGSFDAVIATDVLEHIPEQDIPWVLDKLFGYADKFLYLIAACYPASHLFLNGENTHCTIKPPAWWVERLRRAATRNPGLQWRLGTTKKSYLSLRWRKGLRKKGFTHRFHSG